MKDYKIRFDAYNKDWYLDQVECVSEYDAGEIYACLDEFWTLLEAERRKYVHKLSVADTKLFVLEESMKYHFVITMIIMVAMDRVVDLPIFKEIIKYENFCIHVGEFQDKTFIIYQDNFKQDDTVQVDTMQVGNEVSN